VSPANLRDFLSLPNVAMAGGSWLTPADALATGDWARITALAREAVELSNRH
jgi:2-dehydro-3-deoxyphosphogluconate aldolase / (4S)-4-hydroxy-2-oxoglutarate aldolase